MNENELSLSQHEQALSLHQRIMTSGSLAAQNLWDMANALKEMRDGKLYKELGYQNFESYCEEMVGMTRRNAYRYISIAENISLENVTPVSHFGIKKLALLARLSDEEQKEIAEKIDETTTYKQLQEEINKLKDWNKSLGAAKDRAVAAQTSLEEEINRLKGEKMLAENAKAKLEDELETAKRRGNKRIVAELEERIQELKDNNRKLFNEAQDAKEDARKAQKKEQEAWGKLSIATTDSEARLIKIEQLERENKELRERPVEVAVVENSDNERRLKETIKALEAENYRQNEMMDRKNIEDRRKFEADKKAEIAAIREEYEEKLKAAQSGEDKEKQEFKVFLVMAHDALDRLISAASGKDAIYKVKIKELLTAAERRLED